jgi:hypothetical protein
MLQKPVQRQQAARLPGLLLTVDLLKAQNVRVEPDELRPHHRNTLVQRRVLAGLVIKVLEIERRNAQSDRHFSPS